MPRLALALVCVVPVRAPRRSEPNRRYRERRCRHSGRRRHPHRLLRLGDESRHTFVLVADGTTFEHPEHPLIVVDLFAEPGRTFRALPTQIQSIENNLSIANMDFEDFAALVDADGIFRGFPD